MGKLASFAVSLALVAGSFGSAIAQDASSSSAMEPVSSSMEAVSSSAEMPASSSEASLPVDSSAPSDANSALSAQLEAVKAACPVEKAVEADCRAAIGAYLTALDGLGLDATGYDDQLVVLVKALVTEPCALPEPVRQMLSTAAKDTIVPKFTDDTRRQAATQIADDIVKCVSTEVSAISSTPSPNL